jgi:tetratricopeptide (TPR) repeat protein
MEWVQTHAYHLLYGVVGLLVVVALIVAWSVWQKQRQQRAEILLYKGVKLLNSDGVREGSTPNPGQALAELQRLIGDYSSTPASALAYWYLGHLYFEQGDYPAALAAYRDAQGQLSRQPDLLIPTLITLNISYTHEAAGRCDEAIGSFEQVLQSAASWLHGEAFLGIGRCHESQGKMDQAIATYDRALSDSTLDATIRQKIEGQLAQLRAVLHHQK